MNAFSIWNLTSFALNLRCGHIALGKDTHLECPVTLNKHLKQMKQALVLAATGASYALASIDVVDGGRQLVGQSHDEANAAAIVAIALETKVQRWLPMCQHQAHL